MTIVGISPRKYQEEIFLTCRDKNCLVVLPTGVGKTLIALMLAVDRLKSFPSGKVLFLAPTKPLAEQQMSYFRKHLTELFATIEIFTGGVEAQTRKKLWQRADIIFSTPQCIANDLKKNLYDLSSVCLLVEDEAHRCLKNYDYNYVAHHYLEVASNPRVLGMTASPGSDKAKIKEICDNLGIEALEVRTRDSDDVKEYLQELEVEVVKVDYPPVLSRVRDLLKGIYDKKVFELKSRKLLFGPGGKKSLLELQARLIKGIIAGNKNFNSMAGSSACAQALKVSHAIELIETQTLSSTADYFKDLFDQAASKKSKSVQTLVANKDFLLANDFLLKLIGDNIEHPKLAVVKGIIKDESIGDKRRAIIFTQFRSTATAICKSLNSLPGVNSRVFVGQLKKGDTGLSQREQSELLNDFRSGSVNVLCATSIGEEGLDLPEVSLVVFYEPIPSAIRKIQRGGRTARLKPGKVVTLVTQKTRDEIYFWAAFHKEKKMYSAIDSISKDFKLRDEIDSKEQKVLGDFDDDKE
ncbi:MAG: DEAD/DEAH box helicase [Nanoarchaeota archaeon]